MTGIWDRLNRGNGDGEGGTETSRSGWMRRGRMMRTGWSEGGV